MRTSSSQGSRRGKKRPRSEASSNSSESEEPPKQQEARIRRPRPQKIIVLGAGVSGLACSRELRQRGYEVLVVEARSRVGGRLKGEVLELGAEYPSTLPPSFSASPSKKKQQKKPRKKKNKASEPNSDASSDIPKTRQHPIDVGGALIHGIENNPIYHIASQMGIPMHAVSSYCLLMDAHGWPFDPKVDAKSSNFFNECLDVTFARAEKDRDSKDSFGVLFDRVCREKSGTTNGENGHATNGQSVGIKNRGNLVSNKDWETPLLKWHRANLELPTGASFYNLGHTWNEDEPYGFDGAHAAVEPSWKLVMERLAEGLNIVDNSPVTEIRVVLPNGTTPLEIPNAVKPTEIPSSAAADVEHIRSNGASTQPVIEVGKEENGDAKVSEPAVNGEVKEETVNATDEPNPNTSSPPVAPVRKIIKRRRKSKKEFVRGVHAAENRRFSRRTRNIDTDVRRSSRSTKGVITRLEYDKGWDDNKRRKRQKRSNAKKVNNNAGGIEAKGLYENGKQLTNDVENNAKQNEEEIDHAPSSVVQITLQNGSVLEADALVCTLPLGVLKLPQKDPSHVRFVPSLGPSKVDAIESLGCGLLNKCAISFPNAFWQDSDFLGLAEKQYSYLVLNTMKYTQKPILIFMYGGDFARDVEDWTDREIISDCLEVLKKICGIRKIPAPIDYCITRWGKEQYSRMAFTFIPSGVDGAKALAAMSQPISDPVLPEKPLIMFAGEHTTPYHPSTMHGAFLSGIREAYRFDLYMEPFLNNQMTFDESIHVYKHTFPTKRVYKRTYTKRSATKVEGASENKDGTLSTPLKTSNSATPSNGKRHTRRRGFSGMTLRKRPDANITPTADVDSKNTAAASPATTSSPRKNGIRNGSSPTISARRSQRSLGSVRSSIVTSAINGSRVKSIQDETFDDGATAEQMKSENKARADQQEARTLVRALESYGPESHSLVRSHIVPVYGSTRRRSMKHINDRWDRLRGTERDDEDNSNRQGKSIVELAKSWEAKHVVSDNWDTHFARIAADALKETSSSSNSVGASKAPRRSQRGSKCKNFFE